MSIHLRQEFVYLAVLMDVFTRCIRGWHLCLSLDQSLTLRANMYLPYTTILNFGEKKEGQRLVQKQVAALPSMHMIPVNRVDPGLNRLVC